LKKSCGGEPFIGRNQTPSRLKQKTLQTRNTCAEPIKIWADAPLTDPRILIIPYRDSTWERDIPHESWDGILWAYIPSKTGTWTATKGYVNVAKITVTFHEGAPVCYYAADIWVETVP